MAEISVRLPKPKYGQIVVLQKNGDEPRGHGFPLTSTICVVGRCLKSDIRITSADVSDTHCKFLIDEVSGEASLEIHGNETEVNGTHFEAVSLIKLNHKDVVLVGGRKLRFEYLPPGYKPLSYKPVAESTDSFSAEVVDIEENGDVVDSNAEKEEDIVPEVPSTPSLKRVSFGPYLSPEQFDNTLPPATPIKKGATPRRSTRYSGLKFIRAPIDSLIEEEGGLETPADENFVANEKECVDETLEDAEASVSSVTSVDETSILDKTSPSLAEATEFLEISARANLDMSSIDAMSTMSDVSNIAVVPSECCSFLDEPVEEGDFEVVEQEDTSLFDDDLIGAEIPVPEITTPHLTNGTTLLRSFTTSSLAENMGEEEEEGITLSPEDMSEGINGHTSTVESVAQLEEAEKESVPVESNSVPLSPQADYTDVRGVKQLLQTPKPIPATPKADYTDVEGVEQLLKTPKYAVTSPHSPKVNNSDVEGDLQKTPKPVALDVDDDLPKDVVPALEPVAQVEAVCGVSVEKLIETPDSSPQMKSPEIANSPPADSKVLENVGELSKTLGAEAPETSKVDDSVLEDVDRLHQTPKTLSDDSKLNCTDLEGVARLLETPKTTRSVVVASVAVGKTPEADYTDVRGIKKLLQTPKPPPNTPKADYRDVRGVKRLLATPKATPGTPKADYTDVEGVNLLMKTPKAKDHVKESDEKEVPEKILEESTPETPIDIANSTKDIVDPKVDEGQPLTCEKEEIPVKEDEVETKVTESRRGQRVSRTPKTKTPNVPSKRTATPSEPEEPKDESSVEGKKSCLSDELAEVPTGDESEESAKIPSEIEQQVEEEESVVASAPKRGRRAATSKTNTPKADYRDVSGVKRLLRTPKAMPETPKADYSDVKGVDLLMKTPKAKDPVPQIEEEEKNLAVVEEEAPEKVVVETTSEADLQSSGTAEEPVSDVVESVEEIAATAPQMDMAQPVVEEEPVEKETNPPKRGRRAAATKVDTPKADYRNVSGVKRLLRTPKAMPGTPNADYSDVEGVDLFMKTPKPKDPVPQNEEEEKNVAIVEEEVPEKLVVESTPEAQTSETIEESTSDVVESVEVNTPVASEMGEEKPVVEEEMKEEEPEPPLPKRGRRAAAAKADTPKADYRNVSGVKRLLKTPKAMPGTPKADYSDVEGVDLLMQTTNSKDPVPQIEEEEKNLAVIEEEVPEKIVVESTPEAQTSEPIEEPASDVVSQGEEEKPNVVEEMKEEEPEAPLPKRGRRAAAAAAKVDTPKADYRNVSGVKRLLRTPKVTPGTPKADYSDVEGVDLLMKTPKPKDAVPQSEEEEKNLAIVEEEEEVPEKLIVESTPEAQTSEPIEEPASDVVESVEVNTPVASQMEEEKPVVEEEMKEEEPEAPHPKRGRRAAAAKICTPKFDYRDVKAIEKLLKTSGAAQNTPKVDCTDVEGVELLTKTPQSKDVESASEVAEESSKKPAEKTTTEAAPVDKTETTDELANEEEQTKESEAEKDVIPARRSRRAVPTPKTNTPKPASRSKRKPPQSEPEIQPEVNDTVEAPLLPATEKEEPAVVEEALSEETSQKAEEEEVPVKSVSTPKRSRRAAAVPASKVETPKATRSTRVKKQSESDSVQAEAETRPVRSKRRKDDLFNDEKLSLSPVVRLCQIEVPQRRVSTSSDEMDKEDNKRVSSSSTDEVAPAKRGRGRPKLIKKAVPKRGKAAEAPVPDVVESVASADEMEEVEAKPAKKTTRRATSKQTVEKVEGAPEEKRRRGGSKPAAGLDDVEMLHEGKGHAADIHANHMPDDVLQETNEESTATTSSGRPTRGRKATLKVHFDVAGAAAAASPVRSTRSTRKTTAATAASPPPDKTVSVLLERDPDIDTLAAVGPANEDEEKVPTSTATKRPRQKKVPAAAAVVAAVVAEETEDTESPAAPAVKRTRGGKKVSTDSDVPKVESSSPPPAAPSPRRTRRTRNI
ncbi:hypothetical protein DAPPUDRAFT_225461 [Daphnia pulex]|uniref:FHA domain-containing protein n=1 Tax=Daphnia pulex TaxID=6669 RepID=E9GQK9_DAPPU|nr:hypothetical protein DAPPUDRAFT_225461 [Daphnia pulex]|eukprot:EFX78309.1 hypothetical protein DAPPUDRAFT_225461 [Daphnia pulex]